MRRILSPHMIRENFGLTLDISLKSLTVDGKCPFSNWTKLIARLEMISSYQHKHDVTADDRQGACGIMPSWSSYIVS